MHHRHADRSCPVQQQSERKHCREGQSAQRNEDGVRLTFIDFPIGQGKFQHPPARDDVTKDGESTQQDQQIRGIVGRGQMSNEQLTCRRSQRSRSEQMRPRRRDHSPREINQAEEDGGRNDFTANDQCARWRRAR